MQQDQSRFVKYWNSFRAEVAAIFVATTGHMRQLGQLCAAIVRERKIRKKCNVQREALGRRMFDAGVGSDKLRHQICDLDERIVSMKAADGPTKLLLTEKRGLLLRLAEDLLKNPMQSGGMASGSADPAAVQAIDDARAAADGIFQEYETHRQNVAQKQTDLLVTDPVEKRRVVIGYAVVVIVALLLFSLVFSSGSTETDVPPTDLPA